MVSRVLGFLHFLLFVGEFAVLNPPCDGAEVLSGVPTPQNAVMCLMEKTHIR